MKKLLTMSVFPVILMIFIISGSCRNERIITFRSLLKELATRETVTRYPDPSYRLVQFSSYDRRSIHPDSTGWFANSDFTQFIREEENDGRREYVMMDAEGPGCIVRWWMTFGDARALNSYIRVYIDGNPSPVIEGSAPQLIGGGLLAPEPLSMAVSPLTEPQKQGYDLYLPIPFSKRCKVTLENDSVVISDTRRSPMIFYNMGTRLYEKGTRIVSLKKEMILADSLAISECASSLADMAGTGMTEDPARSVSGTYEAGSTCSMKISGNGLAVNSFTLRVDSVDMASALSNMIIRLRFDGRQTVCMPAGNFFVTGYSLNPYSTRFSSVAQDGEMVSAWIMPFRDSCEIEILNSTPYSAFISAEAGTTEYEWDSSSMYFGARWHEYSQIETAGAKSRGGTGLHSDLNIALLHGHGLYAGDAVTIFNTASFWWGEGDEKIYVDGETFPSSFGTGTEDYYGYAWGRPEPFSHPLIAQPSGEGNLESGMTVNMRYRILDAIPFNDSIKADIELWHWLKTVVDYHVTAFYYLLPED
jgi:hypothetical protein